MAEIDTILSKENCCYRVGDTCEEKTKGCRIKTFLFIVLYLGLNQVHLVQPLEMLL